MEKKGSSTSDRTFMRRLQGKGKISLFNLKIFLVVVMAVICAVALCSCAILFYITGVLREQTLDNAAEAMTNAAGKIDVFLEDISNYSNYLMLNEQLQIKLKELENSDDVDYHRISRDISQLLRFYTLLRDKTIDNIYLVLNDGTVIYGRSATHDPTQWFEEFMQSGKRRGFSGYLDSTKFVNSMSTIEVFPYVVRAVDTHDTTHQFGNMVALIKYESLSMLTNTELLQVPCILLADSEGRPFGNWDSPEAQALRALIESGEDIDGVEKDGRYFFSRPVETADWTVYGVVSASFISDQLRHVIYVLIAIFVTSLILLVLIFLPVIYRLTSPLNTLVQGMLKVSGGQLETRVSINTKDELTDMADVFNQMVEKVNILLDESVKKEKLEQELKMKLFMAQINPHFICNTLNAIIYQAESIHADDIVEVTKAFISILQLTINHDQNMYHTVGEEIDYIKDYMVITRFRYGELSYVHWDVNENAVDCIINRMLLYPLVENSIFHGFFPSHAQGEIHISIDRDEGYIYFKVSDNGIGMTPERLAQIRKRMDGANIESKRGRSSIGLQNVNRRLLLYYGSECGINIESTHGKGTVISFKIPASGEVSPILHGQTT